MVCYKHFPKFFPSYITFFIETGTQFFIKRFIQIILKYFFTKISATAFITQNITKTGTVFYNFFSIIIARIATRT